MGTFRLLSVVNNLKWLTRSNAFDASKTQVYTLLFKSRYFIMASLKARMHIICTVFGLESKLITLCLGCYYIETAELCSSTKPHCGIAKGVTRSISPGLWGFIYRNR